MTTKATTRSVPPATGPAKNAQPRRRNAANTRQQLLDVARDRFARDGYASTTVRHIADDAGVNVALINRYFESKEGLFSACLTAAIDELRRATGDVTLGELPGIIAEQIAGVGNDGGPHQALLLLLRSSGDERADTIRLTVLGRQSEGLIAAARRTREAKDDGALLLRAQVVLAATMGVVMLRSVGLAPLASASSSELVEPLRDLITAVLAD